MDRIFEGFLQRQFEEAVGLACDSDLLALSPIEGIPPFRYVARFHCKGLVEAAPGHIVQAEQFDIGIWFPSDYLRHANPFQVLTWIGPRNVWHPNVGPPPVSPVDPMVICVGRLAPGTPLIDILYQCFEIITFNKVTMREDDALNKPACVWARANQHRFPIDTRPLKRRALDFNVEPLEARG